MSTQAARARVRTQPATFRRPAPTLRAIPGVGPRPAARVLDRLVGGQGWIVVVAAPLLMIVFMQVHMLKLNTGISRAVETATTLERQNAQLRQDVSLLSAADRVQDEAVALNMVMPAPGDIRYLDARGQALSVDDAVGTMTPPVTPVTRAAPSPPPQTPAVSTGAAPSAAGVSATPAPANSSATPTPTPATAPADAAPATSPTSAVPEAATATPAATQSPAVGGATPTQP